MKRSENLHTEDGLGVDAKSFYQQLTFFGHGVMVKTQSVISCIRKEAGDCLEALDRLARMEEDVSDFDSEMGEMDSNNEIYSISMLDRAVSDSKEEDLETSRDRFLQIFQQYKTLYNKISNLQRTYVLQSQQSNSKWLFSYIPTSVSGAASDRKSEVSFITDLLRQEDIINDPFALDEISINDQSMDWYQTNTKKFQCSHVILVGACIYIHKRIAEEYKDKEPTSDLYLILSKTLHDIDCSEKRSSLTFLLTSAQKGSISLSLPKRCSSQEVETFSMFEGNCQKFITQLEKGEADLDVVHESALLTF